MRSLGKPIHAKISIEPTDNGFLVTVGSNIDDDFRTMNFVYYSDEWVDLVYDLECYFRDPLNYANKIIAGIRMANMERGTHECSELYFNRLEAECQLHYLEKRLKAIEEKEAEEGENA